MPIDEGLVAFTVTPGNTALLVSVTLPLIDPVVLAPPPCAKAVDAVITARHAARPATTICNPRRLMKRPPLSIPSDPIPFAHRPVSVRMTGQCPAGARIRVEVVRQHRKCRAGLRRV